MSGAMERLFWAGALVVSLGGVYAAERSGTDFRDSPMDFSSPSAFVAQEYLALECHYASGGQPWLMRAASRAMDKPTRDDYSAGLHTILALGELSFALGSAGFAGLAALPSRRRKRE